jgi:hypothetical protein
MVPVSSTGNPLMPSRIIRESCRTSPTLDQLTDLEERMFWRLTTVADDHGRFDADPRCLLAACFPLRVGRISPSSVGKCLQAMAAAGLVVLYNVAGRDYGEFLTWQKHQRVRSVHSKFPAPDPNLRTSADICGHPLSNAPGGIGYGVEGMESNIRTCPQPTAETTEDESPTFKAEIQAVFDHYVTRSGRNPDQYRLTPKRRTCIRSRLKNFEPDALICAINACFDSPFHQGQNDRNQVYNSLELNILKSDEKVQWWLDQAIQKQKGNGHA